jgi:hypothetical protein
VAREGVDPLEHFIAIGADTGCNPHPLFDLAWYRARRPELADERGNLLLHYLREGGKVEPAGVPPLSPHPMFDTAWYRAARPEVAAGELNPLLHYLETGALEGTPPNALFDPEWVRQSNPQVGDGPLAPILHHVARSLGRASGRAYHFDRREGALLHGRGRQIGYGQTTDAPCALWDTYTKLFATTPSLPGMDDPIANGVEAYRALCPVETAAHPPEIRFGCRSIPRVSVFVPVSRVLPNTVACLRALAAARSYTQFDLHLVVADADRAACLKPIGSLPGASVVEARDAGSLAAALNRSAFETDRSWVAFVGCGTIVTDGWLDALFESFDGFPGTGLAASALLAPRAVPSRSTPAREVAAVPFGALLMPREVFLEVGGLPDLPLSDAGGALAACVRAKTHRVVDQAASVAVQFPDPDGHALAAATEAAAVPFTSEADHARRALFIDVCTPTPGRDARSLRIFRLMQLVRERGFEVTFAPANLDAPSSERQLVRSHGVRVIASPEIDNLPAFIERKEEQFDLCWISRPRVARQLLEPLRRAQPEARVVVDAADLLAAAEVEAFREAMPQADAIVVDLPPRSEAGARLESESGICVVSKIFAPPSPGVGRKERFDAFLVGGFQPSSALDGLLWFLRSVLPKVLELDPGFRVHVAANEWSRVFTRTDPRHRFIVLVEDRDLQSPSFLDHFRLVVAPHRFGPGVPGLLRMALARGVPCVATSVASQGLAEDARGPRLRIDAAGAFAEAICTLHDDAWSEASQAAEQAIARHFPYEPVRDRVSRLFDGLSGSGGGGA